MSYHAGLPHPRTQIRVSDGFSEAFIDMGYDEPMVGLDYEGSHHSENRGQYAYDIGRADLIDREGWIDIRVVKEHSRRYVVHRVREAFAETRMDATETCIGVVNPRLLRPWCRTRGGHESSSSTTGIQGRRDLGDGHLRGGVGGDDVSA